MNGMIIPDWNWAAIQAFTGVIGLIGVIISVVFLVYEVRHNAKAIEGAMIQQLMGLEREVFTLLGANAALYLKGGAGRDALAPDERFQFDRLVGAQMSMTYSAFVQYEQGLIDLDVWQAYRAAIAQYFKATGVRESWQYISVGYPTGFVAEMARNQEQVAAPLAT